MYRGRYLTSKSQQGRVQNFEKEWVQPQNRYSLFKRGGGPVLHKRLQIAFKGNLPAKRGGGHLLKITIKYPKGSFASKRGILKPAGLPPSPPPYRTLNRYMNFQVLRNQLEFFGGIERNEEYSSK